MLGPQLTGEQKEIYCRVKCRQRKRYTGRAEALDGLQPHEWIYRCRWCRGWHRSACPRPAAYRKHKEPAHEPA